MQKAVILEPDTVSILKKMGEQIKLARLRRKLAIEDVADSAGISRTTLWAIEKGESKVSIGAYAAVLHVLNNSDADFLLIAKEDAYGRALQDEELLLKRAPKRKNNRAQH
ncbi:MAG: helix-turn-helix domain-containing protein [Lachnospiraceae bacterium]|nr:helix-turn-helix domain-containing protein [Lachnospiraceae bacterium]